jgi:Tfp pilus assembly protein PilV
MSPAHAKPRTGFILAEALIAILILGVVFVALEGSLAVAVRALADSERETIATRLAETQRERAFANTCSAGSGTDSANAVTVSWTASSANHLVRLAQTSRYALRVSTRLETYDAIGACQ